MFLVLRILILAGFLALAGPARAEDGDRYEVVAWAPSGGAQALWFDALGGLRAAAEMFNQHGGINGRRLVVDHFNRTDDSPAFLGGLAARLQRPGVVGAVGGVVHFQARETAEHLRRSGQVWLGPWSNNSELYEGLESDPFAVLPTAEEELEALLGYVGEVFQADPGQAGPVYLVFYNLESEQRLAARARELAREAGLDLKRAPINPDFGDWAYLADYLQDARALVIWLSQGQTAALVKAAKSRRPDILYLTSSLNAPHPGLAVLSAGAWTGLIFPAVLKPSREIPAAFEELLRKYGAPGLSGGYQAYLGFAQGRLLARALSAGGEVRPGLFGLQGADVLLAFEPGYEPGRQGRARFYLARALGEGRWEALPGRYPVSE